MNKKNLGAQRNNLTVLPALSFTLKLLIQLLPALSNILKLTQNYLERLDVVQLKFPFRCKLPKRDNSELMKATIAFLQWKNTRLT